MINKIGVVKSLLISALICTGLYFIGAVLSGQLGEIAMVIAQIIFGIAFIALLFLGIAIIIYYAFYDE